MTVERLDGGKLRCAGATSSDAVVIYPGEALALVNVERQVLSSAPKAPAGSETVRGLGDSERTKADHEAVGDTTPGSGTASAIGAKRG